MVQEFNSVVTRQTYLQLAETLEGFLRQMRSVAEMLDVALNVSVSSGCLSRRCWLVRTKLPFDIQFGFQNHLVVSVQFRQTPAKMASKVKITFCVRGVLSHRFEDYWCVRTANR